MSHKRGILVVVATIFFLISQVHAEPVAPSSYPERSWFDTTFDWALANGAKLVAGSAFGTIVTGIAAFKFRQHGLPVENARLLAQIVCAAQQGQPLSLDPLLYFANTVRAAHESGIPLNEDGTFAVDWWRLDERTKRFFVRALKRLSGQTE